MVYRIIYFFLVSVIGTEVILLKKRRIKWSEGEKIYLIDFLKKNTESLNLANNILGGEANVNTYLANETWSSMADDITFHEQLDQAIQKYAQAFPTNMTNSSNFF